MLYVAGLTSPSAVALTCTGGAGSSQAQDPAQERQKEKEQEPRSDGALTRHLPSREAPALEEAGTCGPWLHSHVPAGRKEQAWEDSRLSGLS